MFTGTHRICSSVILRTTLRRDFSKGSAEQIRLVAALHVFVDNPGSSVESVLSLRLCQPHRRVLCNPAAIDYLEVQIRETEPIHV